MNRRQFVFALPLVSIAPVVVAHHGWSSFDESRPLYFEGKITALQWQNPHVELTIVMTDKLALPEGLAKRDFPAQSRPVDGATIFAKATLPKARGSWELELAPLTRVEAWKVAKPKIGDVAAAVGYTFKDEKKHDGKHIARVEYLMIGDQIFGLRSMPA